MTFAVFHYFPGLESGKVVLQNSSTFHDFPGPVGTLEKYRGSSGAMLTPNQLVLTFGVVTSVTLLT